MTPVQLRNNSKSLIAPYFDFDAALFFPGRLKLPKALSKNLISRAIRAALPLFPALG